MKSKKRVAIGVFCLLILTSVISLSTTGLKIEKTDDSWVKITKPKEGCHIRMPVTLKAEASSDIDYVKYSFYFDYSWHESESWRADDAPYTFEWNDKSLMTGDHLKIRASGYANNDSDPDFYFKVAESEAIEVTILENSHAVICIKVHKASTRGMAGVEGVKVTCTGINLFNDYENVQITDKNGNCEFGTDADDFMPYPGKYKFVAEKDGYKTAEMTWHFKLGDPSSVSTSMRMYKKSRSALSFNMFSNLALFEKLFSQSLTLNSRLLKI